ncbi:MAG: hypothetical protein QOJ65_2709 [Fimbriimonadaceae bacterium]|jgi:hypothetical protein|nr:hypothetical protein [Fimbriimonadaceae bacterium]
MTNSRLFGCGKFKWLSIERFDRSLTPKEDGFYRKHREVCFTCMRYEQQGLNAMNMLNSAALEPEISENFDERVLRNLRVSRRPVSLAYWSPAFAGAAVAVLALVAALQLLSRTPVQMNQADRGAYNYQRDAQVIAPNLPNLEIPRVQ